MGVELENCRQVAELIGVKTFLNEFIAYDKLQTLIKNTDTMKTYNGTWNYVRKNSFDMYLVDKNITLIGGILTVCINEKRILKFLTVAYIEPENSHGT